MLKYPDMPQWELTWQEGEDGYYKRDLYYNRHAADIQAAILRRNGNTNVRVREVTP